MRAVRGDASSRAIVRFCAAWVLGPLALLSLSSGKLPTYVLPLFPPIAAIVAAGLLLWREGVSRSRDAGTTIAVTLVRLLAIACFTLALVGAERVGLPRPWLAGEAPRWVLLGLAMLTWSALELWAHRAGDAAAWLLRMAWVPVPGLLCVHLLLPDALLGAPKVPWALLARNDRALREAETVVLVNSVAHAVNWSTGRTDLLILGDPSEFDNELGLPNEASRLVPQERLDEAAEHWIARGGVTMIVDTATADQVMARHATRVRAIDRDRDLFVLVLSGD